jgi:hypothetical protein
VDEELPPATDATPPTCPPHHWLVEADPEQGDQRWVCHRCGVEQFHAAVRDTELSWHRGKLPARHPQDSDPPA